jgi:hypothetical protein
MTPSATPDRYKHHRFPAEIISHGVWLYYRFCLSYRDVEELLFTRGVLVTYEAIRKWCRKFGQQYATKRRRLRSRDYSRPLASEPDVKVSLHPAQASRRPCEGPVSTRSTCWLHDTRRWSIPLRGR